MCGTERDELAALKDELADTKRELETARARMARAENRYWDAQAKLQAVTHAIPENWAIAQRVMYDQQRIIECAHAVVAESLQRSEYVGGETVIHMTPMQTASLGELRTMLYHAASNPGRVVPGPSESHEPSRRDLTATEHVLSLKGKPDDMPSPATVCVTRLYR